jgi:hypothetical protein
MTRVKLTRPGDHGALPYGTRLCAWDEKVFQVRTTGGQNQLYCSTDCKRAHEASLKAWARQQQHTGKVTLEDLRALAPKQNLRPKAGRPSRASGR